MTQHLPPYPEPMIVDGEPHWFDRHMDAYGSAAYQAGFGAAIKAVKARIEAIKREGYQ